MSRWLGLAAALALVAVPVVASAQNVPPITERMVDRTAIACVKIDASGTVDGAFLIRSSGDAEADADILAWVGQLHWPAAVAGEAGRGQWLPMPVAFGNAKAGDAPPSCGPRA